MRTHQHVDAQTRIETRPSGLHHSHYPTIMLPTTITSMAAPPPRPSSARQLHRVTHKHTATSTSTSTSGVDVRVLQQDRKRAAAQEKLQLINNGTTNTRRTHNTHAHTHGRRDTYMKHGMMQCLIQHCAEHVHSHVPVFHAGRVR